MGHYVRVFCASFPAPSINKVLNWSESDGYQLKVDPRFALMDLDSPNWKQTGLLYEVGEPPFLCEVDHKDDSDTSLVRQEVRHFEELLAAAGNTEGQHKALQHIRQTEYIVSIQTPSDFDEQGSDVLSSLLTYFIRYCAGMVQVDGEGFYDGDELIVKLE